MTVHVSQLVRGCVCQLRQIKTIRKFIPTSSAVILVNSFIVFRVDYYNNILAGLQTCQVDRIQSVLITPLASQLIIWSDTIRSCNRSICCETTYIGCVFPAITYKALNDHRMSDYISNFFIRVVADKRLQSSSKNVLLVPRSSTKFGDCSFSIAGTTEWKSLPDHVKN